ncbi:Leucine-responsive regulatory protein [Capnocytophaga canimorsus]|nr:Leucine-responsive regulatory protein [Capnocytophaga canimorsus]
MLKNSVMKINLDDKNRQILGILQQDSSLSVKDIAAKIGLSFTPTYERIKALEEAGVIKKYVALVDREKVGLGIVAICNVQLKEQSKKALLAFEKAACLVPEIVEIICVSGQYDYMLRIVSTDIKKYNEFVMDVISSLPNVWHYHSSIILSEVKQETAYHLPQIQEN